MANDPQLTLSVLADIKGLQTGMQQAERVVADTSTKMKKSVDDVNMGARFQKQSQIAIGAIRAITSSLQTLKEAQGDALKMADGLAQTLTQIPNKFAMAVGASHQLGSALYDLITGASAAEAERMKQVQALQRNELLDNQTRDLQRQLAILKEMDPIKKIELEGARELALIEEKANLEQDSAALRRRVQAEKELSIERTRQRLEEANKKTASTSQLPDSVVDTITTSIGGSFRVAQGRLYAIQAEAAEAARRTADNTRAMLDFMRRGTGVIA